MRWKNIYAHCRSAVSCGWGLRRLLLCCRFFFDGTDVTAREHCVGDRVFWNFRARGFEGCAVQNRFPVGDVRVNYTHSFVSGMLLKSGMLGAALAVAYISRVVYRDYQIAAPASGYGAGAGRAAADR